MLKICFTLFLNKILTMNNFNTDYLFQIILIIKKLKFIESFLKLNKLGNKLDHYHFLKLSFLNLVTALSYICYSNYYYIDQFNFFIIYTIFIIFTVVDFSKLYFVFTHVLLLTSCNNSITTFHYQILVIYDLTHIKYSNLFSVVYSCHLVPSGS